MMPAARVPNGTEAMTAVAAQTIPRNVGEPLLLMLDFLPGFDFTRCVTTPVVSIEKIDFDPADGPPDDASVTENVE